MENNKAEELCGICGDVYSDINIKYDFYTLISEKFDLKDVVFNYLNIYFLNNNSFSVFYDLNNHDSPPPLSRKLVLSKIQSFLI